MYDPVDGQSASELRAKGRKTEVTGKRSVGHAETELEDFVGADVVSGHVEHRVFEYCIISDAETGADVRSPTAHAHDVVNFPEERHALEKLLIYPHEKGKVPFDAVAGER